MPSLVRKRGRWTSWSGIIMMTTWLRPPRIDLSVGGLPANLTRALLEHFRVDSDHSNAYRAWKEMGSPQSPTDGQYEKLRAAGQLQSLDSPMWIGIQSRSAHLQFDLPRQGLSLVRITW